ncbi:Nn.00g044140.m01.CDS01 [Neocucurbitaria sp. VM-36]
MAPHNARAPWRSDQLPGRDDTYHRRASIARGGVGQAGNEPPAPSLVHRMTFDNNWYRARNSTTRGRAVRSHAQRGPAARLHDLRIRHGENDGGGRSISPGQQVSNGARGQSARMASNRDHDDEMDLDDIAQSTTDFATTTTTTTATDQGSSLFYGSQPTQVANIANIPATPLPRPSTSAATAPRVATPRIRMVNRPVPPGKAVSKRPINKYRGKDPIKKLVQNPKLRAIFADLPLPRARKKALADRPDLRMGASKITK